MLFKQQKHLVIAAAACSLLFIFSCGENSPLKPKVTAPKKTLAVASYLAKDTIGFFRGAEFGDETDVIRLMENDTFKVFDSPNLLEYEYKLPAERRYKLNYTFKKNRLSNFSFDLYLVNSSEADNITTELKEWFRKKYGKESSKMGIYVWRVKANPDYKEAYLELKDESEEFGYGKINISAYAIR